MRGRLGYGTEYEATVMDMPSVVILGGGLSGIAAAYALACAGWRDLTILERGASLGGLAGSFERNGRFYPLGYHHILHRDRTLLFFLDLIGALPEVRWRSIRMLFEMPGGVYDLGSASGFLRFPMALPDKLRFVRLMLRAFRKSDWSDWEDMSAADLIDAWASAAVRRTLFEPLCQLKFQLPCDAVSAAWLGARLHFREGSAPLGYIPHTTWTKALCEGLTRLIAEHEITIRLQSPIATLKTRGDRVTEAVLSDGEAIAGDVFVSTVPTEIYRQLVVDDTAALASIRYTALLSMVCASEQRVPDFYWMNLGSLRHSACAVFLLNSLNPSIGNAGEACVNFVTHLSDREHPLFRASDDELLDRYLRDFHRVFGFGLTPFWSHLSRVSLYSPIFVRGYRNPPLRSTTWQNVYFAGNYRTFPSVASTGTALASGLETAARMLEERGQASPLPAAVRSFRLRAMPRAAAGI